MVHVPGVVVPGHGTVPVARRRVLARWNVTPVGPTWTSRTVGPGRALSTTQSPSNRFAVSNAFSAGTPSKRWSKVAVSTARSESRSEESSGSSKGAVRKRRRERRARAAQVNEPIPRTRSSGRRSGRPRGLWVRPARVEGRCALGVAGKSEPPSLAQVVGIDESLRRRNLTRAIERSEDGPLGAVAELCLSDDSRGCRPGARHTRRSPPASMRSSHGRPDPPSVGAAAWTSGATAPATDETATGAPTDVRASTPRAMRPASQSVNELGRAPASPRRTRSTTDRSSWAQQAAQAIHAASVSTHSASRARGDQSCPTPPESGFPTANTSTAGTAVKTRSAAANAPAISATRLVSGSGACSAIGRPDRDGRTSAMSTRRRARSPWLGSPSASGTDASMAVVPPTVWLPPGHVSVMVR